MRRRTFYTLEDGLHPNRESARLGREIMTALSILVGAAAYAFSRTLRGALSTLMIDSDFVAANYRGERIPKGMGILIPLAALVPIAALAWFGASAAIVTLWLALLFGMAFLGLFDDAAGDRSHGGFHEHFRALFSGKATTGGLKALYGGALSLYAGWSLSDTYVDALVAAVVIALATNAVNLLDVRPGRALKGYSLLMLVGGSGLLLGTAQSWHWGHLSAGVATLGAALPLWSGDHSGEYMLGDAGSNVLGVSAGLWLAATPLWWQLVWLGVLLSLHVIAERYSVTEIIGKVEFLDRIDRWGRPGAD